MVRRNYETPRLFPLREGTLAVSHGDTFGGGAEIAAYGGCASGSIPDHQGWGPDCADGYGASGWWVWGECRQGFGVISRWKCSGGFVDIWP